MFKVSRHILRGTDDNGSFTTVFKNVNIHFLSHFIQVMTNRKIYKGESGGAFLLKISNFRSQNNQILITLGQLKSKRKYNKPLSKLSEANIEDESQEKFKTRNFKYTSSNYHFFICSDRNRE